MALHYTLDDELLEIIIDSDHDLEEFIECVDAAQRDPLWTGSAWLLIDVSRNSAVTHRTPREMRRAAQHVMAVPGRFRWCTAVLVSSRWQEEIIDVGARFAELIGGETRLFYDRAEAVEWLRNHPGEPPAGRDPPPAATGAAGAVARS